MEREREMERGKEIETRRMFVSAQASARACMCARAYPGLLI